MMLMNVNRVQAVNEGARTDFAETSFNRWHFVLSENIPRNGFSFCRCAVAISSILIIIKSM